MTLRTNAIRPPKFPLTGLHPPATVNPIPPRALPRPPFPKKPPLSPMLIQIAHYQFEISAPFAPGHVMDDSEAKALNGLRAERIRNMASKRLSKVAPQGRLLSQEEVSEFALQVQEIDREFEFVPHPMTRTVKGGIAEEIKQLAQERFAEHFRHLIGREPSTEELLAGIEEFSRKEDLRGEAHARFAARQEVLKGALSELMGSES